MLFNIFSYISWREQVTFQWDGDDFCFAFDQHACWIFIVLAHSNNSPRVDMSFHSADTLSQFRANKSLILLFDSVWLALVPAVKQHIPIVSTLFWPDRGSNPQSISLKARIQGYCMHIGEQCPEQYIILHQLSSAVWYIMSDNIHQYSCNNPFII